MTLLRKTLPLLFVAAIFVGCSKPATNETIEAKKPKGDKPAPAEGEEPELSEEGP